MRTFLAALLSLAMLAACSHTVLVPVPPRMALSSFGTLGIIDFSGPDADMGARAARKFEEQVQAAQPGTPFLELGDRAALLKAVARAQLDTEALKRIGEKYGVAAVFTGEIAYAQPTTNVRLTDLAKLEGAVHSEMRGDISSRLFETRSGASVWSSSAWARRGVGDFSVSAERGVRGGMSDADPREEMMPALVYHLTEDFRPTTVRQPAK